MGGTGIKIADPLTTLPKEKTGRKLLQPENDWLWVYLPGSFREYVNDQSNFQYNFEPDGIVETGYADNTLYVLWLYSIGSSPMGGGGGMIIPDAGALERLADKMAARYFIGYYSQLDDRAMFSSCVSTGRGYVICGTFKSIIGPDMTSAPTYRDLFDLLSRVGPGDTRHASMGHMFYIASEMAIRAHSTPVLSGIASIQFQVYKRELNQLTGSFTYQADVRQVSSGCCNLIGVYSIVYISVNPDESKSVTEVGIEWENSVRASTVFPELTYRFIRPPDFQCILPGLEGADKQKLEYKVHVIQSLPRQRMFDGDPDTYFYGLEVTITNPDGKIIGGIPNTLMKGDADEDGYVAIDIASELPYKLIVKVIRTGQTINKAAERAEPVKFAYGGDFWDSNDASRVSLGLYDGGDREMDTSFEA